MYLYRKTLCKDSHCVLVFSAVEVNWFCHLFLMCAVGALGLLNDKHGVFFLNVLVVRLLAVLWIEPMTSHMLGMCPARARFPALLWFLLSNHLFFSFWKHTSLNMEISLYFKGIISLPSLLPESGSYSVAHALNYPASAL